MKYLVTLKGLGCVEEMKTKQSINVIGSYPKLRGGKVHNINTF